ncbi:hypothetical protein SAMD00019534_051140, partial [Acytostelium subglobosum LB1]|uniref:hypothetical protein n=1 Tax=Acytostelium subglobosum LB1 TaxID=1410327 RepID=UPI000644D434
TYLQPALTLGNVPQLAIDLIINTYQLKRVGFIHNENVVPLIGNDTFDSTTEGGQQQGTMSLSVEVFQSQQAKITLVQQRSPILEGCIHKFANSLLQWYKQAGFRELLFLASTNANKRTDSQLTGTQLRYVAANAAADLTKSIERAEQLCLVPRMETEVEVDGDIIQLSDRLTGLGRELMRSSNNTQPNIPMLALVLFCSEGENTPDAINMANHLAVYTGLANKGDKIEFKIPSSWKLLQGPSFDQSLFF